MQGGGRGRGEKLTVRKDKMILKDGMKSGMRKKQRREEEEYSRWLGHG